MSFWRRLRPGEEEETPPPVVRKPRTAPAPSRAAPPGRDVAASPEASHLGPGLRWKGHLTGKGQVHIEGTFEGVIEVEGEVVVGEKGRVQVERLEALTLVVAGAVQGPVKARHVILRRTGRLYGDVITTTLEAESGGFLRGQVRMEEKLSFTWEAAGKAPGLPDEDRESQASTEASDGAPTPPVEAGET